MVEAVNVGLLLMLFGLGYVAVGVATSFALMWIEDRRWAGGDIPDWMILSGPILWPLVWVCCIAFLALWVSLLVLFRLVDWYGRDWG